MGKSKKETQTSAPWAEAQPYLKDIMQRGASLSQNPTEYFSGNTNAGMSNTTSNALNMAEGRALGGNSLTSQAQDTISGFMQPQQANLDAVTESVRSQVNPAVNANALLAGRTGSPAHAGSMSRAMTNAIAPYAFNANESAQNRAFQAAQYAPQLANADLDTLMQVGRQREGYDQRQINADRERFDFGQNQPWQDLSRYNALVQGHAGLGGTTVGKKPGNLLGDILGGVGTGASFSDERLKKNIKKIGEADNGLPIYSYQYVWGGPTQIGFMAQDVEKVNPDAVGEKDGYKTVDYSKAA